MSAAKIARRGSPPATPASGGDDHVGALPDALLHHILSFLPAQQVVRTCVLARRWLDLWKSSSGLRVVGADGKEPVRFEDVRVFVDNLLLLRGCSPLETLELTFSGGSIDMLRVRLWIRHAVLCKVRVLLLKISGAPTWFQQGEPALVSEHLTRLVLRGIVFNDDDFLDFSRCPSLQDLNLMICSFENTRRISSKSLKHLVIMGASFSSRTRIDAPNLECLQLQVHWGRIPVLEKMPSLVLAIVNVDSSCLDTCSRANYGDCGDESCRGCIQDGSSSVLLQGLSETQALVLTATIRMYVIRRDLKRCPTFRQLKTLVLNEYWCVPDIHPLKCILEHSPVLEALCLLLFSQVYNFLNEQLLHCKTIMLI
uniref:F-box domain-containing protein n=1 Tax=Setaria viridis TaxID=4556 RepID=A0A4V6D2T4_SETVI|nr:hypothetical protein SEVIR_8G072200v2 [Setaria viridis]